MSTHFNRKGSKNFTTFYGGLGRGACIQINDFTAEQYIQFTEKEAKQSIKVLKRWIKERKSCRK